MTESSPEVADVEIPYAKYLKQLYGRLLREKSKLVPSMINPMGIVRRGRVEVYYPLREREAKVNELGMGMCILCGRMIDRTEPGVPDMGYYAHYDCFKKKMGIK